MKIGFVGAGKVGCSLGKYFISNNVEVTGFYSKSSVSSEDAAEFTCTHSYLTLESLLVESDIIFITTPDDAIASIWKQLRIMQIKDKIICHTSGSLSSDIFKDIGMSGASGYSVHPMYAFCDRYNSFTGLNKAYFSIEGSPSKIYEIKALIESCGNKALIISKDKKVLYHLSNVFASNMVLSLMDISIKLMKECGLDETQALEAIKPLVKNNLDNIFSKGLAASATGPIERADENTIYHHLNVLPGDFTELYKILSLNLLEICQIKNPYRDYTPVYKLLNLHNTKRGEGSF